MDYDVGVFYQGKPIKLFKIGFFNNGFFIGNFLGKSEEDLSQNVIAFKAKAHQLKHGISKRRGYLFRRISSIPKYSHHSDGFAQFSMKDKVISGKDELTGKPKGLGSLSFPLDKTNDGGPFAGLLVWGHENLPAFSPAPEDQCISTDTIFENDLLGDRPPIGLRVEFLYVLKEGTDNPEGAKFLRYQCGVTGKRLIQILPTPESYKGNICVDMCFDWVGFQAEQGFAFTGGPGKVDKQNYSENLALIFPDPFPEKDLKNLNLTDIDKIQYGNRRNFQGIL